MNRLLAGLVIPAGLTLGAVGIVWWMPLEPAVSRGIMVGLAVALAQSLVSAGAMAWTWENKYFYWAWGGGFLFRLLVFAATAFVVHMWTQLSLIAVLLPLVIATTLFLVVESYALLGKKNGFS